MQCKVYYEKFTQVASNAKSASLLFVRLIIAYNFYEPAMMKISDISSTAMWFESMGIPLPTLNAYMAAGTEIMGVILLTLGLMTRVISVPLIIIMFVAIATVHGENGYAMIQAGSEVVDAWVNGVETPGTLVLLQNGFEIPLYYIGFLLVLVAEGAGKFSLDRLIFGEKN